MNHDVGLHALKQHLRELYPKFSKAVLSDDGISPATFEKLTVAVDGYLASGTEEHSVAISMLESAAYRRRDQSKSTRKKWLGLFSLLCIAIVVSIPFSRVQAQATPSEETWYQTAIAYTGNMLEWIKVVNEGMQTISKGVEYMTKVMDNQLGSIFDLQTEQYNKMVTAQGTATEQLLTAMENQQKAWARLSSRPGGSVCVDGALYGGFLGLMQSMGDSDDLSPDVSDEPTVPSAADLKNQPEDTVIADHVSYEQVQTFERMRTVANENNEIQISALATIGSSASSSNSANSYISYVSDLDKKQDQLGSSEFQVATLLRDRLRDTLKDPERSSEQKVADNRLKMLAEGRMDLLSQEDYTGSMSLNDYYDFLILQYQIPEFMQFVNSSGPGPEPLLRELIGMQVAMLQLMRHQTKLATKQLDVISKSALHATTLPASKQATDEAIRQIQQQR